MPSSLCYSSMPLWTWIRDLSLSLRLSYSTWIISLASLYLCFYSLSIVCSSYELIIMPLAHSPFYITTAHTITTMIVPVDVTLARPVCQTPMVSSSTNTRILLTCWAPLWVCLVRYHDNIKDKTSGLARQGSEDWSYCFSDEDFLWTLLCRSIEYNQIKTCVLLSFSLSMITASITMYEI